MVDLRKLALDKAREKGVIPPADAEGGRGLRVEPVVSNDELVGDGGWEETVEAIREALKDE